MQRFHALLRSVLCIAPARSARNCRSHAGIFNGLLASFLPCLPAQHDPAWKDALIKEGRRHRELYTRVSTAQCAGCAQPTDGPAEQAWLAVACSSCTGTHQGQLVLHGSHPCCLPASLLLRTRPSCWCRLYRTCTNPTAPSWAPSSALTSLFCESLTSTTTFSLQVG